MIDQKPKPWASGIGRCEILAAGAWRGGRRAERRGKWLRSAMLERKGRRPLFRAFMMKAFNLCHRTGREIEPLR